MSVEVGLSEADPCRKEAELDEITGRWRRSAAFGGTAHRLGAEASELDRIKDRLAKETELILQHKLLEDWSRMRPRHGYPP